MNAKRKSIKSDLKKIDQLKDEDIDYSDSPELDDSFFIRQIVELPKSKTMITIRLDHEVIDWFRERGEISNPH